jgi:hypothetical protein
VSLRNALACAIFGTAAASGCAQILGYAPDYHLIAEGDDAGGDVVEGDAAGIDEAGGDAAADVGGADDAGSLDGPAATDGMLGPGDAGPLSYCQSRNPAPLFCDDFDEDAASLSDWSYIHQITGNLALYRTAFTSPPASMIAQTHVVTGSNVQVDTAVYRSFSLSGQTFQGTIELDLRVDQVDSSTGVAVLAQFGLTDGNGNGLYFLQFVVNANGANPLSCHLNEDYFSTTTTGNPVAHDLTVTAPLKRWTHLKLSMAVPFAGGAGTATVIVNGGPPSTTPIMVAVQNFSQTIGVGLLYASTPSNGWTVVVDNVVFDAKTN